MQDLFFFNQDKPTKMLKHTLIISLTLAIFLSCKFDQGLEPTRSGFEGTIYFSSEWPDNTDQVIVVAAKKFPPTDISEIVMGEPLPLEVDSAKYYIWTPPQEFSAVGVVWKEKDQPWDVTNIIGIYFPTEDKLNPGSVIVPDRQTMVPDIDIEADLSKSKPKVESSVSGMLNTKGEWPPMAESVIVVGVESKVFYKMTLVDLNLSMPISAPFDSVEYSLTLKPGTYIMAALVLEKDQPISLNSIKGIYPGFVTLKSDSTKVNDVNITLDFESTNSL